MYKVEQLLLLIITALCAACPIHAELWTPSVFSDHMVLQRDKPVPVWGRAEPGEKISVTFAGQTKSTVSSPKGTWMVKLDPMDASAESRELTIKGSKTITFKDVLVGEVWLGSGQSNMYWPVIECKDGRKEVDAANHPELRLLKVPEGFHPTPQRDAVTKLSWEVCSPESVKAFSAAGYYFAREIHQELKVPVGIIQAAVGATRIHPWIPYEAWEGREKLQTNWRDISGSRKSFLEAMQGLIPRTEEWLKQAQQAQESGAEIPDFPNVPKAKNRDQHGYTTLYNGMIHPLVPYALRGFLWYQGEANAWDLHGSYFYTKEALIEGWRDKWGEANMPFYFVQLAPFKYGSKGYKLAEFWETQTKTLEIPHTGMAIINDVGNIKNIHPPNKQAVGKRLALLALAKTYDKDIPVYSGALYDKFEKAGNAIRVHFKHTGGKLASRDGEPLDWFEIAGSDGKYVEAKATIDGDTVLVSSPNVKDPVSVRFAWDQIAEPNLINAGGLPTSAFRTTTQKQGTTQ